MCMSANAERSSSSSIASTFHRGSHRRIVLHSAMSVVQDRDARVIEIDRRIASSTQDSDMQELKTARNALAPLGRLPDELLLDIARRSVPQNVSKTSPRQVLSLTWICRRLRALFVECPRLWNHIVVSRSHRLSFRAFLERASPCTLDVLHIGTLSEEACGALLECLPRAATCHWSHVDNHTETDGRWLQLLNSEIKYPELHTIRFTNIEALPSIEQAMFPNLVVLEITEIATTHGLPDLPALRTFQLAEVHFCSLEGLHSFFSHSPLLESIDLGYLLDDDEDEDDNFIRSSGAGRVVLPHLHHLRIQEIPECIRRLLHILPDPTSSIVLHSTNIEYKQESELEWDFSPSAWLLLHLQEFWNMRSGVEGSLPGGRISFDGRNVNNKVLICFDGEGLSYKAYSWHPLTAADPLLESVKTLELNSIGGTEAEAMHEHLVLDCLPNVEDVLINRLCSATRFNADDVLSIVRWISARSEEGRPLQSIVFQECDKDLRPLFDRLVAKQVATSITWK
jgi:hypothetical protein